MGCHNQIVETPGTGSAGYTGTDETLTGDRKMTNPEIEKIIDMVAESIKRHAPGYIFKGAMLEAIDAGYKKDTREYNMFVGLWILEVMDIEITTNPENLILSLKTGDREHGG